MKYLFFVLFFITNLSYADPLNIVEAYRLALTYDAQFAAARANNLGQHDEIDLAKSAFFPKVGFSINQGRSYQDASTAKTSPTGRGYSTQTVSLNARQPIYNKANMAGYDSAKANAEASDASLEKEKSTLLLRLTSAYLSVLSAIDNIDHSKQLKAAAEMQLESAHSRFKNGQGTVTEISESLAQKDDAIAEELKWLNAYEESKHSLEMIIGEYPDKLFLLDASKIRKSIPDPKTMDEWIALGLENSFEIRASQKQVEVASYDL
jgi:outer membrane protein TolC